MFDHMIDEHVKMTEEHDKERANFKKAFEGGWIIFVTVALLCVGMVVYVFTHRKSQITTLAGLKMRQNPTLTAEEAQALAELDVMRTAPLAYRKSTMHRRS